MNREVAIEGARLRRERALGYKREARRLRKKAVNELRDLEEFCKKHGVEFVLEEDGEVVRNVPPPHASVSGITVALEK